MDYSLLIRLILWVGHLCSYSSSRGYGVYTHIIGTTYNIDNILYLGCHYYVYHSIHIGQVVCV